VLEVEPDSEQAKLGIERAEAETADTIEVNAGVPLLSIHQVCAREELLGVISGLEEEVPQSFPPHAVSREMPVAVGVSPEHLEQARDMAAYATREGIVPADRKIVLSTEPQMSNGSELFFMYLIVREPLLTEEQVATARTAQGPAQEPTVNALLTKRGADLFGDFTQKNIGKHIAIVVDGRAAATPVIASRVSQAVSISGSFTQVQAESLAKELRGVAKRSSEANEPPSQTPPTLASSEPAVGATDVDPGLKTITLSFNQDMNTSGWSVTGGGDVFPPIDGEIHYKDERTLVIPVDLEPGKFYRFGINSKSHNNFRNADGVPARHEVVAFCTEGASEEEKAKLAPPRIVSLEPANGAEDVPPDTAELRVEFNQTMGGGMSWTRIDAAFPQTPRRAQWNEERTVCTLPVALEPGREYGLSLNSPTYAINFQTEYGIPLEPVEWRFTTAEAAEGENAEEPALTGEGE
jgi:hypothetical protein